MQRSQILEEDSSTAKTWEKSGNGTLNNIGFATLLESLDSGILIDRDHGDVPNNPARYKKPSKEDLAKTQPISEDIVSCVLNSLSSQSKGQKVLFASNFKLPTTVAGNLKKCIFLRFYVTKKKISSRLISNLKTRHQILSIKRKTETKYFDHKNAESKLLRKKNAVDYFFTKF